MTKQVGMTTDLTERMQYWKKRHPKLTNWIVRHRGLTYDQALKIEKEYREKKGYVGGDEGGRRVPGPVWNIYTFEY